MKINEKFAAGKPEDFKVSDYFSQVFSMCEGTESEITLLCENELMTYVIDWFGENVPVTSIDKNHFSAIVKVSLSQTFFGHHGHGCSPDECARGACGIQAGASGACHRPAEKLEDKEGGLER